MTGFRGVDPSLLSTLVSSLSEAAGSYRGLRGLINPRTVSTNFQGAIVMPDLSPLAEAAASLDQAASIARAKYRLLETANSDDDAWLEKYHAKLRSARNNQAFGPAAFDG